MALPNPWYFLQDFHCAIERFISHFNGQTLSVCSKYSQALNIVSITVQVEMFILVLHFSFVISHCISSTTTIKSPIELLLNYE